MSLGIMKNFYSFRDEGKNLDFTIWSMDSKFLLQATNSVIGRYSTLDEAVGAAAAAAKFDEHGAEVCEEVADLAKWSTGCQPERD